MGQNQVVRLFASLPARQLVNNTFVQGTCTCVSCRRVSDQRLFKLA